MMKKTLLIAMTVLAFAQTSSALTIKPGTYQGQTDDNGICSLVVRTDGGIGLFYPGAFGDGLAFSPKSSQLQGNTLTVSGSADFGAGKAEITLANDGTPIEALMGVGPMFKFSYDVDCKNLVAK